MQSFMACIFSTNLHIKLLKISSLVYLIGMGFSYTTSNISEICVKMYEVQPFLCFVRLICCGGHLESGSKSLRHGLFQF